MTVTRYSTQRPPEFLTHRNFGEALVQRYLDVYYPYDPFYGYWCEKQRTGVAPLRQFSSRELKHGLYIAEFLRQSAIRDEVGVLLDDGPHATLAVFLERSDRNFRKHDVARLERAFPLLQAVHAVHRRLLSPGANHSHDVDERPRRARLVQRQTTGGTLAGPHGARARDCRHDPGRSSIERDRRSAPHIGRDRQNPPAQYLCQARHHGGARNLSSVHRLRIPDPLISR